MRDVLAGLSGASLGYIHGNTRGAIAGWGLARRLSNRMAPITRKNSNPFVTPGKTNKRIKLGNKTFKVVRFTPKVVTKRPRRARKYSIARKKFKSFSDPTAVKMRKKRGFDAKKPKRVRITKKFRAKVHKAMSEMPYGFYQQINCQNFYYSTTDQQYGYLIKQAFSPTRFWMALSTLFNFMNPPNIDPSPTDAGMISQADMYSCKLYVKKSWFKVDIRNNGQRTQYLSIYEAKRKGPLTSNLVTANSFQEDWEKGLKIMQDYGANPLGVTPGTLKADPRSVPQVNENWNVECTRIRLDPGETYVYTMTGPSDVTLNYQKLFTSNTGVLAGDSVLAYSKFTRDLLMTAYPDIVGTTLGGIGRYNNNLGFTGDGLLYERSEYYVLECPEIVGFTFPAVYPGASGRTLDRKRNSYAIKNFNPNNGSALGTIQRIDEENPITVENPPVN